VDYAFLVVKARNDDGDDCYLQMPPKGAIVPYDPENFDESFAAEYGGYTFSDNAGGGGGRGGRGGPRFVVRLILISCMLLYEFFAHNAINRC